MLSILQDEMKILINEVKDTINSLNSGMAHDSDVSVHMIKDLTKYLQELTGEVSTCYKSFVETLDELSVKENLTKPQKNLLKSRKYTQQSYNGLVEYIMSVLKDVRASLRGNFTSRNNLINLKSGK